MPTSTRKNKKSSLTARKAVIARQLNRQLKGEKRKRVRAAYKAHATRKLQAL